jgi:hypothetical protein
MSFSVYYAARRPVAKSAFDRLRASRYQVAAEGQPAFRRAFALAVRSALTDKALGRIEEALERDDPDKAINVLIQSDAWEGLEDRFVEAYKLVFDASAERTLRALPRVEKAKKLAPAGLGESLIRRRAAELVADVTKDQKASLAQTISNGFRAGQTPAEISKRVRKIVGLLPREVEAVENAREGIERQLRARYPKAKRSFIEQRADSLQDQYAAETLTRRADRIAITETSFAEARGKRAAWSYAKEKGVVEPSAKRRWVTSDAPCPECKRMAGKTAEIDGTYRGGIEGPPLHPHCFCLEEIA